MEKTKYSNKNISKIKIARHRSVARPPTVFFKTIAPVKTPSMGSYRELICIPPRPFAVLYFLTQFMVQQKAS